MNVKVMHIRLHQAIKMNFHITMRQMIKVIDFMNLHDLKKKKGKFWC